MRKYFLIAAICICMISAQMIVSSASIHVQIFEEGLTDYKTIPSTLPVETEHFAEEAFAFFHIPHRYVYSGVRADRPTLLLIRATGQIELPAGEHRLLIRSLGKSQLKIDDQMLAQTPPVRHRTDGQDSFQFQQLDLGDDIRRPAPGVSEQLAVFQSQGGLHQVVFEFLVGGILEPPESDYKKVLRAEANETTVSIQLSGDKNFYLLTAKPGNLLYTDKGWWDFKQRREIYYSQLEADRRKNQWQQWKPYWDHRHEYARSWSQENPAPEPRLNNNIPPNSNQIDQFLTHDLYDLATAGDSNHSLDNTTSISDPGPNFQQTVWPIIEAKCRACHSGEKAAGGLRLDLPSTVWFEASDNGVVPIVAGNAIDSELFRRITIDDDSKRMPPPSSGKALTAEEVVIFRRWINAGAELNRPIPAKPYQHSPPLSDLAFLRKVYYDTIGIPPTEIEIEQFQADPSNKRRSKVITQLLRDPRWADHWVSYWQEVLAENPNLINATLNNTGPFRYWIYEALLDNKPFDVFVTELLSMEGGVYAGGPKGFGLASQNDVPMAAKAIIVSSAFLGINMKCARCHDAPFHQTKQRDLFELAAMLKQEAIEVPTSSSVDLSTLPSGRKPLIAVTLQVGTKVEPRWTLTNLVNDPVAGRFLPTNPSLREQLAFQITRPENQRFSQVIVNRIWARLTGEGLIEPVDDWEGNKIYNSDLLTWLASQFITHNYDTKHIISLILSSRFYQSVSNETSEPRSEFIVPQRRLLGAEQIVDSLVAVFGKRLSTEQLSLDLDISRGRQNAINFGLPRRSWQLTSLSNERDRPSLALPETQSIVDVLEGFGWHGSRMEPRTRTKIELNLIQPGILANGVFVQKMTTITPGSEMEKLVVESLALDRLVRSIFLRLLTRYPTANELVVCNNLLRDGFEDRVVRELGEMGKAQALPNPAKYVTWSNHLQEKANSFMVDKQLLIKNGPTPSLALQKNWRQRCEDLLWALVNSPEMIFSP